MELYIRKTFYMFAVIAIIPYCYSTMNCTLFQKAYGEIEDFYLERGRIYLVMQQFDKAQSDFRKAASLSTISTTARQLLVQVLLDTNRVAEAITETNR